MKSFCQHLEINPTMMNGPLGISRYGRTLRSLDLQCASDLRSVVSSVIQHCEQLKKLAITLVPDSYGLVPQEREVLNNLFSHCQSLRDITVKFIWSTRDDNFPWECTSLMPREMSRLALYGCPWMPAPPLIGVCVIDMMRIESRNGKGFQVKSNIFSKCPFLFRAREFLAKFHETLLLAYYNHYLLT